MSAAMRREELASKGRTHEDDDAERLVFRRRPARHEGDTLGEIIGDAFGVDLGPNTGREIATQALKELGAMLGLLELAQSQDLDLAPDVARELLASMGRRARFAAALSERVVCLPPIALAPRRCDAPLTAATGGADAGA